MRVTVNGKPRNLDCAPDTSPEIPLPEFLRAHDVNPRLVAIAINGDVIPKDQYDSAVVREGDALEIVRMVGGGA